MHIFERNDTLRKVDFEVWRPRSPENGNREGRRALEDGRGVMEKGLGACRWSEYHRIEHGILWLAILPEQSQVLSKQFDPSPWLALLRWANASPR
jgi:hypothetical protein